MMSWSNPDEDTLYMYPEDTLEHTRLPADLFVPAGSLTDHDLHHVPTMPDRPLSSGYLA